MNVCRSDVCSQNRSTASLYGGIQMPESSIGIRQRRSLNCSALRQHSRLLTPTSHSAEWVCVKFFRPRKRVCSARHSQPCWNKWGLKAVGTNRCNSHGVLCWMWYIIYCIWKIACRKRRDYGVVFVLCVLVFQNVCYARVCGILVRNVHLHGMRVWTFFCFKQLYRNRVYNAARYALYSDIVDYCSGLSSVIYIIFPIEH